MRKALSALSGFEQSFPWRRFRGKMEALSNRLFGLELQQPFSGMVMSGMKTIETRSYPLPSSLLYKHICLIESKPGKDGVSDLKDFAYNRTGNEEDGKEGETHPRILGTIVFSECFEYESEEQWKQDCDAHCVSVETYYDWPRSRNLEYMIKEERKERERQHREEVVGELIKQLVECSLMKREETESLSFLEISSIVDADDGDDGSVSSTGTTNSARTQGEQMDGTLKTILKKKKEGGLRSKLGSLRKEKANKRIEKRAILLDSIKPRTMSSGEEFGGTIDSNVEIDTMTQTSELTFELESCEVDIDLDDMIEELKARPVADRDRRYGWRIMGVCPNATIKSDKVPHFVRVYRSLFDCGSYALVDYL